MSEAVEGGYGVFRAYGDELIVRRIVELWGDREGVIANITSHEEWLRAQREERDPVCVGFRMRYFERMATDDELAGLAIGIIR